MNSGTGSGCSATYWQPVRERESRKKRDEAERKGEKSVRESVLVSDRHTESERGMLRQKKGELSSLVFLLGLVQDSPPGEKPDLKRRLRHPTCLLVWVCVFSEKREVDGVSWTLIGAKTIITAHRLCPDSCSSLVQTNTHMLQADTSDTARRIIYSEWAASSHSGAPYWPVT